MCPGTQPLEVTDNSYFDTGENLQLDKNFAWAWFRRIHHLNLCRDLTRLVEDACLVLLGNLWAFYRTHGNGIQGLQDQFRQYYRLSISLQNALLTDGRMQIESDNQQWYMKPLSSSNSSVQLGLWGKGQLPRRWYCAAGTVSTTFTIFACASVHSAIREQAVVKGRQEDRLH